MEHQTGAPADHAFQYLPVFERGRRGEFEKGPGESLSEPHEPASAGWRCRARYGSGRGGNAEPQNGRGRRDSTADQGRDTGGAYAQSLAREPGPCRARAPQHLPADETVLDIADAANLRCAGYGHKLRPARELDGGAAGTGS